VGAPVKIGLNIVWARPENLIDFARAAEDELKVKYL
jgi:hypothetical protein